MQRSRIERLSAPTQFVMQMRAGGQAGHADSSQQVTLLDRHADCQSLAESLQMTVVSRQLAGMTDQHEIAVTATHAGKLDHAIGGNLYWRARRRSKIDTGMGPPDLQDRMKARHRITRGGA